METVFIYILKVNALLVLFYLVYQLALSRETFYKHSRWFLLSGLFVSLLLPFVTFTKIEYYEVRNSIDNQFFQAVSATNEVLQEPILTNQEILFLVYGMICFGFLIKTLFDFFKLFKIINVSNSEKRDNLVYINTNLVHTPFSFFNYIVFNEELINPIELQNIIKHEEAHSMQKHSFDTLLAQFFIILFWFNPIVWLYRKSIVQNLEFLADSFAISQVSDRTVYQKTMLKITTQSSNISIINTFNQSSIKKRIIMLNTNQSNKKNALKYAIVIPVLVAFIMLFQVKVIAKERLVHPKDKNWNKEIRNSENVIYLINAYSTNKELDGVFKNLKEKHQFEAKYYGVKRNKKSEIIAIKVKIKKNEHLSAIHEVDGDTPIDEFAIQVNTKKNTIEIMNSADINNEIDNGSEVVTERQLEEIDAPMDFINIEVPEIPEAPILDVEFPEAPEVPEAPEAPSNPNDKKAWAKFEKEMATFEKKMKSNEGNWKKFEVEMKAFENKMKSLEPKMKKFEEEMKVYENKVKIQTNKISITKQIELENGDVALIFQKDRLKVPGKPTVLMSDTDNVDYYVNNTKTNNSEIEKIDPNKIKNINVQKSNNGKTQVYVITK
jgi:hypothetical protein